MTFPAKLELSDSVSLKSLSEAPPKPPEESKESEEDEEDMDPHDAASTTSTPDEQGLLHAVLHHWMENFHMIKVRCI